MTLEKTITEQLKQFKSMSEEQKAQFSSSLTEPQKKTYDELMSNFKVTSSSSELGCGCLLSGVGVTFTGLNMLYLLSGGNSSDDIGKILGYVTIAFLGYALHSMVQSEEPDKIEIGRAEKTIEYLTQTPEYKSLPAIPKIEVKSNDSSQSLYDCMNCRTKQTIVYNKKEKTKLNCVSCGGHDLYPVKPKDQI
jgi:hypothetical protein